MTEITFTPADASADYWNGWLGHSVASAITKLRRANRDGSRLYTADEVARDLERSLDAFLDAFLQDNGRPDSVKQALNDGLLWGWVVEDARGEPYTLREDYAGAQRALSSAESYLDGAATCGHPAAGPWVRERLPFVLRQVTRRERAELIEEWGTPVLDREP